jgi:hypothetical protein
MGAKAPLVLVSAIFLAVANWSALAAPESADFGASDLLRVEAGKDPVEAYTVATQVAFHMCGLVEDSHQLLAQTRAAGGQVSEDEIARSNYVVCIVEMKKSLRKLFDRAMGSTKKAGLKTALREHFVQAIVALDGVTPRNERVLDYDRRQSENKTKLREAEVRLEVAQ